MYQIQSISVFVDIAKFADVWKNGHISRTVEVYHMIYIFFGSFLGKV